jgi:4-diphosphocytidyl-2-C-methyl-D-erythritol kinase
MSSAVRVWRAPAKVNLTLHILGRREDGWHDLDSIVAFAGCGDVLSFAPGRPLALTIDGPTAEKTGATSDNLVLKAARLLQERIADLRTGAFHLDKRLPVAAGLGGGSSDAAAALRALADENNLSLDDPRLGEAARACGADVLVCLDPRARMMTGVGDLLGPGLKIPPLHAVLANPGAAVPTPAVFARMGLAKGQKNAGGPSPTPPVGGDYGAIVAAVRQGRNDMQEAALSIAPIIGDALEALRHNGALVARMSGSGATCFALYEDRAASLRAARTLAREHPDWWIKATVLR